MPISKGKLKILNAPLRYLRASLQTQHAKLVNMYELWVVPELLAQTLLPSEDCYDMDLAILVVYNPMEIIYIYIYTGVFPGVLYRRLYVIFWNIFYSHLVDSVDALIRLVIWTVRSPCWNLPSSVKSLLLNRGKVSHVIDVIAADSPTSHQLDLSWIELGTSIISWGNQLCRWFFGMCQEKIPPKMWHLDLVKIQ